jgi:DNA primase
MLMPDGALKLQLMAEIAELVQLTTRELTELWIPSAPQSNANKGGKDAPWRKSGAPFTPRQTSYRPAGRAQPASRADHAARILLGHTALWETLTSEDHALLCELSTPHGDLFVWLEGQLHDHGVLPWEALRESMTGLACEDLAVKLMSGPTIPTEPLAESEPELRDLLNRMLVERIKQQETEAIEAAKADPSALQRYQELRTRRVQLMHQLEKNQIDGIIQG